MLKYIVLLIKNYSCTSIYRLPFLIFFLLFFYFIFVFFSCILVWVFLFFSLMFPFTCYFLTKIVFNVYRDGCLQLRNFVAHY